jgi:hypothetical protein
LSGGGVVVINANSLYLNDGSIRSNGISISNIYDTAAGGSISINTGTLEFGGTLNGIQANGGGSWDFISRSQRTGGGGRVAVHYTDAVNVDWSRITAHGGAADHDEAGVGSAGTVVFHQSGQYPILKVANVDPFENRSIPSSLSTTLEVVGRHTIDDVVFYDTNQYLIILADNLALDRNCVGYWIDPDASDNEGPYYEIVAVPDAGSIVVYSEDDLAGAGLAGNELTGVHRLAGLQVVGEAVVDFGDDLLVLDNLSATQATEDDVIVLKGVNAALFDALAGGDVGGLWQIDQSFNRDSLTLEGTDLMVKDLITTNGLIVQSGVSIQAENVSVGNDVLVDAATLSTTFINVPGDLNLQNNAVLTSPAADPSQWYRLHVLVGGTLSIHGDSAVDVSGKGYAEHYTWDNASIESVNSYSGGSHGGYGGHHDSYTPMAPYGDYLNPQYPGSGGWYNDADDGNTAGGGAVIIEAGTVDLNQGMILANGKLDPSTSSSSSAGGSIEIQAGAITDNGTTCRIAANAGGQWDQYQGYTGGGGRVAISTTDPRDLDATTVTALGGPSLYSSNKKGSAGTVYLQVQGATGHLTISNVDPANGQTIESEMITEMQVIGRRTISTVTRQTDPTDRYEIVVAEALDADKDYTGYWVDVDLADDQNPYYQVVGRIADYTLVVQSDDDLTLAELAGKELAGVHRLETLTVTGMVAADFGDDIVIVDNPDDSLWDAGSSIIAGPGSELPVQEE